VIFLRGARGERRIDLLGIAPWPDAAAVQRALGIEADFARDLPLERDRLEIHFGQSIGRETDQLPPVAAGAVGQAAEQVARPLLLSDQRELTVVVPQCLAAPRVGKELEVAEVREFEPLLEHQPRLDAAVRPVEPVGLVGQTARFQHQRHR